MVALVDAPARYTGSHALAIGGCVCASLRPAPPKAGANPNESGRPGPPIPQHYCRLHVSGLARLPDTIAGSLPKPGWLAALDQLWAGWLHEGEWLAEAKRDAVRIAVLDQGLAGLSIVTDGEHTRDPLTRPVAAAKMSALARGAALAS